MQLQFPIGWLKQSPSEAMMNALRGMCIGSVLGTAARIQYFSADITRQNTYLVKQGSNIASLHWLSLDDEIKRSIAYHAMNFSSTSLDGNHLQSQIVDLLQDGTEQPGRHDYLIFQTPKAITIVNEARLSALFDGDISHLQQDDIDRVFLTLAIKPTALSAHSLILLQQEMNELHDLIIPHLIPDEINMTVATLDPYCRV